MTQTKIAIGGSYRIKPEVFAVSVQANGEPFKTDIVEIVQQKFPNGRKTAWFYDRAGNAFRASELQPYERIAVEF